MAGPRTAAMVGAVVSISLLHHWVPPSSVHWHNIFQYLYFLPIAWAALSFGWRGGLVAAVLAGGSHLPDIVGSWTALPDSAIDQATDIPLFCVAGVFVGLIAERERRLGCSNQSNLKKLDRSQTATHNWFRIRARKEPPDCLTQVCSMWDRERSQDNSGYLTRS